MNISVLGSVENKRSRFSRVLYEQKSRESSRKAIRLIKAKEWIQCGFFKIIFRKNFRGFIVMTHAYLSLESLLFFPLETGFFNLRPSFLDLFVFFFSRYFFFFFTIDLFLLFSFSFLLSTFSLLSPNRQSLFTSFFFYFYIVLMSFVIHDFTSFFKNPLLHIFCSFFLSSFSL